MMKMLRTLGSNICTVGKNHNHGYLHAVIRIIPATVHKALFPSRLSTSSRHTHILSQSQS